MRLNALYYPNDGRRLGEIKLPFVERLIEGAALHKVKGTYLEELLAQAKLV